ncbi:hypothetical protein [Kocuria sabuli]|uniref:hypothetical protein n=1 Tax=Kocuria sabuli TaxID=3071448 RepID=UPI0034D5BB7C
MSLAGGAAAAGRTVAGGGDHDGGRQRAGTLGEAFGLEATSHRPVEIQGLWQLSTQSKGGGPFTPVERFEAIRPDTTGRAPTVSQIPGQEHPLTALEAPENGQTDECARQRPRARNRR